MDKYLETLTRFSNLCTGELCEALRVAIDLMRAAESKNPAAERKHCEKTIIMREWQKGLTAEELMASRQEARIEACAGKGMQEFRRVQAQLSAAQAEHKKTLAAWLEQSDFHKQQLSAARAERDKLFSECLEWSRRHALTHDQLLTAQAEVERLRLAAEDATEIERLKNEFAAAGQDSYHFETKLKNLRAAAEHAVVGWEGRAVDMLRAAIEASR